MILFGIFLIFPEFSMVLHVQVPSRSLFKILVKNLSMSEPDNEFSKEMAETNSAKKIAWDANKIMSISAILVSFMTFLVLIYQTSIIREQQLLSVFPYLTVFNQGSQTPNYRFVMNNQGIGPAILEKIEISYQGNLTPYQDIVSFVLDHSPQVSALTQVLHSNIYPGRLVPAGEIFSIFEAVDSYEESVVLRAEIDRLLEAGLTWKITYSSVYGKQWEITESSLSPTKISR